MAKPSTLSQGAALFAAKAREDLASYCLAYRSLCEQEDEIKKCKQELMNESIKPLAQELSITKEEVSPGITLQSISRTTSTIKPERLLEKGVTMSVIQYATEERVSEYYTVTASKVSKASKKNTGVGA